MKKNHNSSETKSVKDLKKLKEPYKTKEEVRRWRGIKEAIKPIKKIISLPKTESWDENIQRCSEGKTILNISRKINDILKILNATTKKP